MLLLMADKGKSIAATKCFSCHKTSGEKLVEAGWKGDEKGPLDHELYHQSRSYIDKDPEVQAQLELCLVRMPNQNLGEQDARSIVEFMRHERWRKIIIHYL